MSIYEKIDRLFIERGTSVYKEAEKLISVQSIWLYWQGTWSMLK